MNPKISIIVPNYNHSLFLNQRLKTIFDQNYSNFELILLDDGSSDNSQSILKNVDDSRISYLIINDVNSASPFSQWLKGISYATGDYIWIAESDDFCEPSFLEKLVNVALKGYDLVYCRSVSVDIQGKKIDSLFWPDGLDNYKWRENYFNKGINEIHDFLIYRNTIPNASSCIFKRKDYEIPNYFSKLKFAGDWIFWAIVFKDSKIAFIASELNYFRTHNSTSRSITSQKKEIERFIEFFFIIRELYKKFKIKKSQINRKNYTWIFERIENRILSFKSLFLIFYHVPYQLKFFYFKLVLFPSIFSKLVRFIKH